MVPHFNNKTKKMWHMVTYIYLAVRGTVKDKFFKKVNSCIASNSISQRRVTVTFSIRVEAAKWHCCNCKVWNFWWVTCTQEVLLTLLTINVWSCTYYLPLHESLMFQCLLNCKAIATKLVINRTPFLRAYVNMHNSIPLRNLCHIYWVVIIAYVAKKTITIAILKFWLRCNRSSAFHPCCMVWLLFFSFVLWYNEISFNLIFKVFSALKSVS